MTQTPPNPPAKQQVSAVAFAEQISGPVPDPGSLERYEKVLPGLAERLIKLSETEVLHRRDQEQKQLVANIELARENQKEAFRGQIFGFLIGISALITASVTAILGAPGTGGVIGGTAVVGLVAAFIIGRKGRQA